MTGISYTEYWTEIESIADDIIEEAMESADNDREQAEEEINDYRLHEWIDGHQWVIYYAYNIDVIRHSDNEDYMSDNFGGEEMATVVKERGFNGLTTAMAFWCMYADVQDRLDAAFEAFEANLNVGEV